MPLPKNSLIFVTGASGCIAMHMVNQLLEAGYRVRGSARGKRLEGLKKAFAKTDRFEAIDIPDIASSNLTHAFEGVDALLHTAAPLPGEASTEVALNHAVDGTLHVLTAAKKAGIRRIVVTGSLFAYSGTVPPFKGTWGPEDWLPISLEAARQLKHAEDMWGVYAVEKKFTEVAVVDFAKENLDTSVTIISPAFIYGPLASGFQFIATDNNPNTLSSNGLIYSLTNPANELFSPVPGVVDVRDVARVHIAAIESDAVLSLSPEQKRFALFNGQSCEYTDAVKFIAEARPELKPRLTSTEKMPVFNVGPIGSEALPRIEEVFGISASSFKTWKETVLDAIDSLMMFEKYWAASTAA